MGAFSSPLMLNAYISKKNQNINSKEYSVPMIDSYQYLKLLTL